MPVDAGALDAEQDAQVDGGPAGVGLAAVAALLVPRQTLDTLQDGVAPNAALPRLTRRIDTAGGRRTSSVQMLNVFKIKCYDGKTINVFTHSKQT